MKYYLMKILTEQKTYEYKVKQISAYQWDQIMGFNNIYQTQTLVENMETLEKICALMINPSFLSEFYLILNRNRKIMFHYKNYLVAILIAIHMDLFHLDKDFKEPNLLYIEGDNTNEGDYKKYDYIKDEQWNYKFVYEKIVAEDPKFKISI